MESLQSDKLYEYLHEMRHIRVGPLAFAQETEGMEMSDKLQHTIKILGFCEQQGWFADANKIRAAEKVVEAARALLRVCEARSNIPEHGGVFPIGSMQKLGAALAEYDKLATPTATGGQE